MCLVPTNDGWPETVARGVAREVRRLRERPPKLSAQQLADRCAELGMPSITRAVLADLENGRRLWIGLAEVMVLARALNTSPVSLIYPDPCADEIEMLPGVKASGQLALAWFSGLIDGPATALAADDGVEYDRNMRPVRIARQSWELRERAAALMRSERRDITDQRSEWVDLVADLQRRINGLTAEYNALMQADDDAR
jgi:hypothetical protein